MSGNHNEDSRRPQESRKRAASIGSEHPSLRNVFEHWMTRKKLLSSNEHEERFACNSLLAERRDQFRPQLRSKPQLTTIASHRCVCVHLRFGKNRGPCTSSDTVGEEDDMYSLRWSLRIRFYQPSTRCVRKESIHITSMERKKATGSPCGCARSRPAFAQSSSTHVITAHTKERCAFPCARPCPSPASSTCRPPPPPTPILPPPPPRLSYLSLTCRYLSCARVALSGLPYQGRLRSGRRGLPN